MPVVAPEAFGRSDMAESFRRAKRELNELLSTDSIKSLTVMVGLPGSGKSTFAAANDRDDVVIFDSVAAQPGARTALINAAEKAGKPIDLVFVDTPFDTAQKRNAARKGDERVSDGRMEEARVLLKAHPPTADKGFRNVTVVRKEKGPMPLKKTCSIGAFRDNIATERAAGKPMEQAVAIARRTLEESCAAAGRPVPKAASKEADAIVAVAKEGHAPVRAGHMTDLDKSLHAARPLINPRDYAVIHHAAKSAPVDADRLTALERVVVEKASVSSLSNDELRSAFQKFKRRFAAAKRKGDDTAPIIASAKRYVGEMRKRGIRMGGSLVEACAKEASPATGAVLTGSREEIRKGFVNGTPEGGMHAHGLDRLAGATFDDGAHMHLFVMPGTREVLVTFEDGHHTHELDGSVASAGGSKHTHSVMMPDLQILLTSVGGEHTHPLMVETTGFGGDHTHTLRLPDGQVIESLTVEQFIAEFMTEPPRGRPMPPASFITNALNEVSFLEDENFELRMDLIRAEELAAEGAQVPTEFRSTAEVIDISPDEIVMQIGGGAPFAAPAGVLKDADVQRGDIIDLFSTPDGCTVVGFSEHVVPSSSDELMAWQEFHDTAKSFNDAVPFSGPDDARVLFIASHPSALEFVRREALVGPDAETLVKHYLKPLGLERSQVALGFAVPVMKENATPADAVTWRPHLIRGLQRFSKARVVALGRFAKDALDGLPHHYMPHPAATRKHRDTSQVDRKVRALAKALDGSPPSMKNPDRSPKGQPGHGNPGANLAEIKSELAKAGKVRMEIVKTLTEERIVEGILLDPYDVDLQTEWAPPAEVEKTAYGFVEHSRLIGFRHVIEAEGATLVSSFVEPYPTPDDRERAHQNLPHKAYRRPFGDDVIKSGSWAVAVRLPEALWQQVLDGSLNAFSIGGGSFKIDVPTSVMPEVEFIDLTPTA